MTEIYCHRSVLLRYAFAAAVGKRLFSERLSSGQKQIIEHHRAVQWAENAYISLVQLVQDNERLIHNDLDEPTLPPRDWMQNNPNDAAARQKSMLFEDYCDSLQPIAHTSIQEYQRRMDLLA